jgi:hypothetical protein
VLVEAITLATDFRQMTVVHETIEKCGNSGRIAKEFRPSSSGRFDVKIVAARS